MEKKDPKAIILMAQNAMRRDTYKLARAMLDYLIESPFEQVDTAIGPKFSAYIPCEADTISSAMTAAQTVTAAIGKVLDRHEHIGASAHIGVSAVYFDEATSSQESPPPLLHFDFSGASNKDALKSTIVSHRKEIEVAIRDAIMGTDKGKAH